MDIPLFSLNYQLNHITFCMMLLFKHRRVKHIHFEHVFDLIKKIMIKCISEQNQLGHETSVYLGFIDFHFHIHCNTVVGCFYDSFLYLNTKHSIFNKILAVTSQNIKSAFS